MRRERLLTRFLRPKKFTLLPTNRWTIVLNAVGFSYWLAAFRGVYYEEITRFPLCLLHIRTGSVGLSPIGGDSQSCSRRHDSAHQRGIHSPRDCRGCPPQ